MKRNAWRVIDISRQVKEKQERKESKTNQTNHQTRKTTRDRSKKKKKKRKKEGRKKESYHQTGKTTRDRSEKKKKKRKKKNNDHVSSSDKSPESDDLKTENLPTKTKKKKPKVSSKVMETTKKHASATISSNNPNYRIQRELKEFLNSPPPNLRVKVGSNIRIWIVTMVGANNTIYEGEIFKLRIQFPKDYPTVPPSVYFQQPTPQHEHVYTNGDICLSLLGKDWRPTMTAQSIAVSILSILSSAQSKSLPMDNARHSHNKPGQYQKDWVYHDDNC
mmetsp:Transcript_18145/g.26853  ORF Transcript_18145/g.26853 Transcript_18145/m.26853 type:complete len:276 (-) Transcript_18145:30-857(-)